MRILPDACRYRAHIPCTAAAYDKLFPVLPTLQAIRRREEKIDYLESEVTVYLFKIVDQQLSDREAREAFALLDIVKMQEAIGDVIEVRLTRLLAEKKRHSRPI